MFVNVILAKYEEMSEHDSPPVTAHDLNKFRKLWMSYDPLASRWVTDVQLREMFTKLDKHIGYDELAGEETLELSEMRLPDLPDGSKGVRPATSSLFLNRASHVLSAIDS